MQKLLLFMVLNLLFNGSWTQLDSNPNFNVDFQQVIKSIFDLFDNDTLKCPETARKEVGQCIETINIPLTKPDVCRIMERVYSCIRVGFEKCSSLSSTVVDSVFKSTLNRIVEQKGCLRPSNPKHGKPLRESLESNSVLSSGGQAIVFMAPLLIVFSVSIVFAIFI